MAALTRPSLQQGRQLEFVSALVNEARALGTTMVATWGSISSLRMPRGASGKLCSLFDNVILAGFTEGGTSEPTLRIIKRRNGPYERTTLSAQIGLGGYS